MPMSKTILGLVLCSIVLSSFAQILLKMGMSHPDVLDALKSRSGWTAAKAVSTNIGVVGGLALYFGSALVWLLVLSRLDVSLAYPFVGLGFIITMLLAWLVRGETLSVARICGTLLIAFGVLVVGRS
jgi:drug/metabolite transporter (DMT)-like permease